MTKILGRKMIRGQMDSASVVRLDGEPIISLTVTDGSHPDSMAVGFFSPRQARDIAAALIAVAQQVENDE